MAIASAPFHLMTKPAGAACNLDCTYCFYLERYDGGPVTAQAMSDADLERLVAGYFTSNPAGEVAFAWQGGEPTLMGLDWFRRLVAMQRRLCPPGRTFSNALQTNGTLLDDDWCRFLADERFLVGISIDGPPAIHDRYRLDRGKKPTFVRVMDAINRLKRFQVEFNTLTVVGTHNQDHAGQVYRFLRKHGSGHMQFIPLVERHPSAPTTGSHDLAGPPPDGPGGALTAWSADAAAFGRFLIAIFDAWVQADVGRVFIQHIETVVAQTLGLPGGVCVHEPTCGRALVVEHDGGIYSCDHYVYPSYRIGSLGDGDLATLVDGPAQTAFGQAKRDSLPGQCRRCPVLKHCHGGCPKHRFATTSDGEPGLNHLCAGYEAFFTHVQPAMARIANLLRAGQPAAGIMRQRWLPVE